MCAPHAARAATKAGADAIRAERNSTKRELSCLPMGTGAASYESGDFGTSPFFEQLKGRPRPADNNLSMGTESKAQWCARI